MKRTYSRIAGNEKEVSAFLSEETKNIYFESTEVLPDMGFQIRFVTMKHNSPLHWHREMEILYILNGSAVVTIE